jgi:dipeptidyl aminopeptidase/acylaminoacyl peptidase
MEEHYGMPSLPLPDASPPEGLWPELAVNSVKRIHNYAVSPDGRLMAFSTYQGQRLADRCRAAGGRLGGWPDARRRRVRLASVDAGWPMAADGSRLIQLTYIGQDVGDFAWASDGKRIVIVGGEQGNAPRLLLI